MFDVYCGRARWYAEAHMNPLAAVPLTNRGTTLLSIDLFVDACARPAFSLLPVIERRAPGNTSWAVSAFGRTLCLDLVPTDTITRRRSWTHGWVAAVREHWAVEALLPGETASLYESDRVGAYRNFRLAVFGRRLIISVPVGN
jgi:hypothetical protein